MIQGLKSFWQGVRATYDELLLLALLGFLWWICLILIVPGPPATAGLYLVANRIADERRAGFDLFKEGFRTHFARSWLIGLIDVVALVIFAGSFLFYLNLPPDFPAFMRILAIVMFYLLLLWLVLQLYLFPFFVAEPQLPLGILFRNALYLAFITPLYTGIVLLLLLICVVLSAIIPILLVLVAPGLVAVVSSVALRDRLEYVRTLKR